MRTRRARRSPRSLLITGCTGRSGHRQRRCLTPTRQDSSAGSRPASSPPATASRHRRSSGRTLDGEDLDVTSLRGQVVVAQLLGLLVRAVHRRGPQPQRRLQQDSSASGVAFVGHQHQGRPGERASLRAEQEGRLPVAVRPGRPAAAEVPRLRRRSQPPTTLVLDRQGRVAARFLRPGDRDRAARTGAGAGGREGMSFADTVTDGPLLLALPVAALAGLVSFLSPCVLPLVPGYLSYVTGLTGVDLAEQDGKRWRVVLGAVLFVLGFTRRLRQRGRAVRRARRRAGGAPARRSTSVLGLVTVAARPGLPRPGPGAAARAAVPRAAAGGPRRGAAARRASSGSAGRPASARRSARCRRSRSPRPAPAAARS